MLARVESQNVRINRKKKRYRGFLVLHSQVPGPGVAAIFMKEERMVFLHAFCHVFCNVHDARGGVFFLKWKGCVLILHSTSLKNTLRGRTRCLQSGRRQVLSTKQGRYRQWQVLRIISEHQDQSNDSRASLWGGFCYYQVHQKGFHMAPIVWWVWMHIWV